MAADEHQKAIDLTEQALEKLAENDEKAAQNLVDRAKKIDPTAPQEVLADLDEDAADRASSPGKQQSSSGTGGTGKPT